MTERNMKLALEEAKRVVGMSRKLLLSVTQLQTLTKTTTRVG